ncbi:hypothetical protein [Leuconostoc citreum]|uniref:hypothetical protein n=1 Tax=Leuconostoc citreum TaxID=33964 RepID=UPI0010D1FC6F|nr:hypothetical protein [Leuconostoc citreum]TDG65527.1 hypothetical protein C5L21_000730 [Leuconostoc citreum]
MMNKHKQNEWPITFKNVGLITLVIVGLSLIPLIFFHRFYFLDDTQRGAIGQWYEVGKLLSQGHLPIFNAAAQGSGNYLAEGQWGTFSPLVWLIAFTVYHSSNFVIFSTVFKIILLVVLGLGAFFLAHSMHVDKKYAIIYGFITPFVGFTLFAGAASWVTDLMVSALFPWFWWAFRRFLEKNTGPILVFLIGYSIITIGYVFGTIMLIMTMLGSLIAFIMNKHWQSVKKTVLLGVSLAAATIAVYLPGIAIATVTLRNTSGIFNNNFLSPNLSDLLFSFSPVGYSEMNSWWTAGGVTYMPFMYIGWPLLLIAFLNFKAIRSFINNHKTDLIQWVVPFLIAFLLLFGPDSVGPLRFPVRMMAYFGQLLLLMLVMVISQVGLTFNKARIWFLTSIVLLGTYLEVSNTPARLKSVLVINLIIGLVIIAIAYISSGGKKFQYKNHRFNIKKPAITILSLAIVISFFSMIVQQRTIGRQRDSIQQQHITYRYVDYDMPAKKADILNMAKKYKGNTVVLGNSSHIIMGNDWYVTDNDSMNVYTPVGFKKFSDDFRGGDPTRIPVKHYNKLFTLDKTTQLPLVDLLKIDTIAVGNEDDKKIYQNLIHRKNVPNGWRLTSYNRDFAVIQRNVSVGQVGSVAWSSLNSIKQVANNNYQVKIYVPAHDKNEKVVFSRTAWPGYHVIGHSAKLITPLRGYLTQIEVPASHVPKTITLRFEPPMLKPAFVLVVFSVVFTLSWSLIRMLIKVVGRN